MMRARRGVIGGALGVAVLLAACGDSGEPRLRNLTATKSGPDEFAILPPKPLQIPADIAALPEPTPGGSNLTDPNPLDDAVLALGGRPGAGGGDAALVTAATRHGVSGTVREDLAAEDRALRDRSRPRLLERLLGVDVYNRAYSNQAVSQQDELERFRSVGTRTPASPPDPRIYPPQRR